MLLNDPDKEIYGRHFYYGWLIVTISGVNLLALYGIWYSYSVFLVAFSKEFAWNRTTTSSIFSLFMIVMGLAGPFIGYAVDKYGPRKILTIGALIFAFGLFLCSRVNSLIAFYLTFGGTVGLGGGIIGLVGNSRAIAHWFCGKSGLAAGISTTGIGLGMLIVVPVVQIWVLKYGWRSCFLLLASLAGFLLIPMNAFFQRNRVKQQDQLGGRVFRSRKETSSCIRTSLFWKLFWVFFVGGFVVQAVLIHQVAIAIDAGFHKIVVASAVGMLGLFGTIGRPVWGVVSDRLGRDKAYIGASLALIAGLCSMVIAKELKDSFALYGYAFFFGLGYSAIAPLNLIVAADIFSEEYFSSIYGFLFMGTTIGAAVGPLLSGFIFDRFSGYSLLFGIVAIMLLISNLSVRNIYGVEFLRR